MSSTVHRPTPYYIFLCHAALVAYACVTHTSAFLVLWPQPRWPRPNQWWVGVYFRVWNNSQSFHTHTPSDSLLSLVSCTTRALDNYDVSGPYPAQIFFLGGGVVWLEMWTNDDRPGELGACPRKFWNKYSISSLKKWTFVELGGGRMTGPTSPWVRACVCAP